MRHGVQLLIFAYLSLFFVSCVKDPFITVSSPTCYTFPNEGGSETIQFSCNRDWSIVSSDSWCTASPSSGSATDGDVTVTMTVSPNPSLETRVSTLIIKVEEMNSVITITQDEGLGFLVYPSSFDLVSTAQTIQVDVKKNVQIQVIVAEECMDWIKLKETKAFSSESISFDIAANNSYDSREGKILIKQTEGNYSETIVVRQRQMDGVITPIKSYDISHAAQTVNVDVLANVEYEVIPMEYWIHYDETKALMSSSILLTIDKNDDSNYRSGEVIIKQKDGIVTSTIIISQASPVAIPEIVDLGLSVSWASFNIGATKPEEIGNY